MGININTKVRKDEGMRLEEEERIHERAKISIATLSRIHIGKDQIEESFKYEHLQK